MSKVRKVIVMLDPTENFAQGFLRGIVKYSRLHGPWELLSEPGNRMTLLRPAKNWKVDGAYVRVLDTEAVNKFAALGLPIVVKGIRETIPHMVNCVSDNEKIGIMAAEHLLGCGFRSFAFIGLNDLQWSRERSIAFCRRIVKAGYEAHVYERPEKNLSHLWTREEARLVKWLRSLPKPVGMMACDDVFGRQLIDVCKKTGIRIPEQIGVVGVENFELSCEICVPQLSSVAINSFAAGYETAEILDRLMDGQSVGDKTIVASPSHVVTRQSTDFLAIEDRYVAAAVRFIRDRAGSEMLQVTDVAVAAGLSQRSLQKKFKQAMGRTVHEEIRRARVEHIGRMLVETDMSISQIALKLGYSNIGHMTRFFTKEKQISPLAYRRQHRTK